MTEPYSYKLSVAPMLDWTDRHCRYFHRLLTVSTLLYTEMVTTGAIIFGQQDFLAFNAEEHPVALQLGGSEPAAMAECARLAQERGTMRLILMSVAHLTECKMVALARA